MEQIRQGDILLVAVEKEPPKGTEKRIRIVLAEGELTGHAHTLIAPEIYDWKEAGQRYIRVSGGEGVLYHEDHDPVPVPVLPADVTFRVIPQQEWNLEAQWQKVKD